MQKKQEQKAPDRDAIARATASLPPCNMDRAVVQTGMRDVSAAGGAAVACWAGGVRGTGTLSAFGNVSVNLQLFQSEKLNQISEGSFGENVRISSRVGQQLLGRRLLGLSYMPSCLPGP